MCNSTSFNTTKHIHVCISSKPHYIYSHTNTTITCILHRTQKCLHSIYYFINTTYIHPYNLTHNHTHSHSFFSPWQQQQLPMSVTTKIIIITTIIAIYIIKKTTTTTITTHIILLLLYLNSLQITSTPSYPPPSKLYYYSLPPQQTTLPHPCHRIFPMPPLSPQPPKV